MAHDFMIAIITIAVMGLAAWAVHHFHLWNRVQALERTKTDSSEAIHDVNRRVENILSLVVKNNMGNTETLTQLSKDLKSHHTSLKELVDAVDAKVNILGEATVSAVTAMGGNMENVINPTKEEEE